MEGSDLDDFSSKKAEPELGRKKEVRRRLPPLDVRMTMYEEVLSLSEKPNTFREMIDQIERRYDYRLTEKTISNWTRGISTPIGSARTFIPNPTAELAYVIGVETGDASLNVKPRGYQYRIRLQATDLEFVEAFIVILSTSFRNE